MKLKDPSSLFSYFWILLIGFCTIANSIFSQSVMLDTTLDKSVLVGKMSIGAIHDSAWYSENSILDAYANQCKDKIDSLSNSVSLKVYFGTWCSDSHRWVPYCWSLLKDTQLEENLDLIGLPKDEIIRDSIAPGMDIVRVPTFVFYKNSKEIGRIIENPEDDFASDLFKILSTAMNSDEVD